MVEKQIFGQMWYEEITSLSTYGMYFSPKTDSRTTNLARPLTTVHSVLKIISVFHESISHNAPSDQNEVGTKADSSVQALIYNCY